MSLPVKTGPTVQKETIDHTKIRERKYYADHNEQKSIPTQIFAKANPHRFKLMIRSSRNNIYSSFPFPIPLWHYELHYLV